MALFHSMKQDPYFKHYLQNAARENAEHEDSINSSFGVSSFMVRDDITDHIKFDRINLYDYRRNLGIKDR